MVVQGKSVERKKRKSSKRESGEKGDRKRRRPERKARDAGDDSLVRILTGADGDDDPKGNEKTVNSDSGDDENSESSDPERQELSVPDVEKSLGVNADTVGEPETDVPHNAEWARALSAAHAKKINVTVLLENANLETVKQSGRSGGIVLLNCDDHRHILKKTGRDANDARPDITHQCLLALMDSPLNKAGKLKVYIRTAKNVLIEVHPQTRIPRTIRRFSGLMAELLEKFKVRGTSGSTPLLKVIRNPITSHLPVGTRKIVCTYNTENVVDMREHASRMVALATPKGLGKSIGLAGEEEIEEKAEVVNVLYVIGAMAHGKVTEDWADDYICVSEYPLSAATVCSRLTYTYECLFGIV